MFSQKSNLIGLESLRETALKGTTTVGILVKEGVILAADRRATAGHYIAHRKAKKIVRVADRLALTTAGLVADAQALADLLANQIKHYMIVAKHPITVRLAAHYLAQVLYSYRAMPFLVQLLVAGYDSAPRLYVLDWYGSVLEEKYAATGSGSPIAIGVIEEEYREDMSIEDARLLAVKAVKAALKRDAASGDGIDTLTITRNGTEEREFPLIQLA